MRRYTFAVITSVESCKKYGNRYGRITNGKVMAISEKANIHPYMFLTIPN